VIAVNRPIDGAFAESLSGQFIEVLLAPGFDSEALGVLGSKKNVRLLELAGWSGGPGGDSTPGGAPAGPAAGAFESKPVLGGILLQDRDAARETRGGMRVLTSAQPSEEEWTDLLFAWRLCRHVRSNAIVIVKGRASIGIGAGQTSRVDAVRIAVEKARELQPERLAGSVLASDAFFPFPDGPEIAIEAGVRAIIQPGGSVRDAEVIAAAEAAGVAMVATDVRHFRH
jgi:phosphoribosylaminoimidazolecarboxamide formyltransferase/IMP cyclohydrolase